MFVAGIENKPNNYYYAIQFSLISRITWSSKSNMIFIYFLSYSSELLFLDLTRYLILLHVASYVLRLSLISSVEISVISSCVVDNSISNVVDKNLFLWLVVYLDVIWTKIFDIDYTVEKKVRTIFDIDFSYPASLYSNMIISMELSSSSPHRRCFIVFLHSYWQLSLFCFCFKYPISEIARIA